MDRLRLMKNFKSLKEVHSFLNEKGLTRISSFLTEAVAQETKDLCSINKDSAEQNQKDAEEHFLEEINYFLGKGEFNSLNPRLIINYRRRPKSWAVAAMIGETDDNKRNKSNN